MSDFRIELKVSTGSDIADVCRKAVDLVKLIGDPVDFVFEGIEVNVYPSDDPEILEARWRKDFDAIAKRALQADQSGPST